MKQNTFQLRRFAYHLQMCCFFITVRSLQECPNCQNQVTISISVLLNFFIECNTFEHPHILEMLTFFNSLDFSWNLLQRKFMDSTFLPAFFILVSWSSFSHFPFLSLWDLTPCYFVFNLLSICYWLPNTCQSFTQDFPTDSSNLTHSNQIPYFHPWYCHSNVYFI